MQQQSISITTQVVLIYDRIQIILVFTNVKIYQNIFNKMFYAIIYVLKLFKYCHWTMVFLVSMAEGLYCNCYPTVIHFANAILNLSFFRIIFKVIIHLVTLKHRISELSLLSFFFNIDI